MNYWSLKCQYHFYNDLLWTLNYSNEYENHVYVDLPFEQWLNLIFRPEPLWGTNRNYNMLHNGLRELKEKHLPYKFVQFNKYRHKNSTWITQVIKSIRYRDKLYKEIKSSHRSSPRHFQLKNTLSIYNKLIKKIICEAESIHYNQSF